MLFKFVLISFERIALFCPSHCEGQNSSISWKIFFKFVIQIPSLYSYVVGWFDSFIGFVWFGLVWFGLVGTRNHTGLG